MPTLARRSRNCRPVRRTHTRGALGLTSWHRRAAVCTTLVSLVSWSCAGTNDSAGETARSDSADVAIVLNSQADRMLDWTFARILDLGGAAEGPTAFFRVFPTSIGVDSLGNLYVLDAGKFRVSIFDRAGRHLRSFGRQGKGPGELQFPSDMAVTPAGVVAVHDFARRALVFYDVNGTFTGTYPLPGPLQRKLVLLNDGRVAAAVMQTNGTPNSIDYRLLALGADTVQIARVRQERPDRSEQFSCPVPGRPPYLQPSVVWDAAGDRIAFSDDATYSVHIVDGKGLTAIWRRELPVILATLELAAWEVAQGDSLRFRGCAVPAEEAARKFGYADVAPIIENLAVSPGGGVWVRRRTEVPGERPIDVFDTTGAYVGTLPGGSPFPALFRGTDEIVTVETDDLGLKHIVVYRIRKEL